MILVTGATGNVGRHLVEALSDANATTRLFVPDPVNARGLRAAGIATVSGSFADDASLREAVDGVASVFLLSPPGTRQMIAQQTRLVDAAEAAGV